MGASPPKRKDCNCNCQYLFGSSFDPLEPEIWDEELQEVSCCGIKRKKIVPKKISFEQKFSRLCNQIDQEFEWVQGLKEMVVGCQIPKGKFLTEMNELKKGVYDRVSSDVPLDNPQELQAFKQKFHESLAVTLNEPQMQSSRWTKSSVIRSTMSRSLAKSRMELTRYKRGGAASVIDRKTLKSFASRKQQTFSEILGDSREISKQTSAQLYFFMKFSSLLELHLKDSCCILGRIIRFFVNQLEKSGKTLDKFGIEEITYFIDSTNQFLLLIREAVIDYYTLRMFRMKELKNNLIANDENIASIVTTALFKDQTFYEKVFAIACKQTKERDKELEQALVRVGEFKPEDFTIKDKFCLNMRSLRQAREEHSHFCGIELQELQQRPYQQCIALLSQLTQTRSPINKMKVIISCAESITKQIDNFYSKHHLSQDKWLLDPDQVLSIFCYIIAKAKIDHLNAHIFLVETFSTKHQMMSMSGYYVSVVDSGIQQLVKEGTEEPKQIFSVS